MLVKHHNNALYTCTTSQLLTHVGKDDMFDKILTFMVSSLKQAVSEDTRGQPSANKNPADTLKLYCDQLASASEAMSLSKVCNSLVFDLAA